MMLRFEHLDSERRLRHTQTMRTTLTLDDDVARRLQEVVRVRKTTFKQAVNETLRRGLEEVLSRPKAKPFRTEPADMGTFAHLNYDNIGDLLEIAEKTSGQ